MAHPEMPAVRTAVFPMLLQRFQRLNLWPRLPTLGPWTDGRYPCRVV